MGIKRTIDHIVFAVQDLDKAVSNFQEKFGVCPIFGGYHRTQGTKNALVKLNERKYLELLAPDNHNQDIQRPRWMGVDILSKNQITRWAVCSQKLQEDCKIILRYHERMCTIAEESRVTAKGSELKWQLLVPLAVPEVELIPFLIDWSSSATHPCDLIPEMGCELIELYGTHPNPDQFVELFEELGLEMQLKKSKEISIKATLKTPRGIFEI